MKLIPVAVVLIFMINIIEVKSDDDLSESHDLQNGEVQTNSSSTSHHGRVVSRKAKRVRVSTETPAKTTANLPHRGHRRHRVSKFPMQDNNVTSGTTSPVPRTRRPRLMQTEKVTSKPHAVDHAEELIQRSKFTKRRSHSNFNKVANEEKYTITEKDNSQANNSEHIENNFKNFTDIDIPSENDSSESKKNEKRSRRGYMKTAASDKIKAIASPPSSLNVNTQRHRKRNDSLKTQKYNTRVERKMVPGIALQKESSGPYVMTSGQIATITSKNLERPSINNKDLSSEEKDDQIEFIFVKEKDKLNLKNRTTTLEDNDIVTMDPIILI